MRTFRKKNRVKFFFLFLFLASFIISTAISRIYIKEAGKSLVVLGDSGFSVQSLVVKKGTEVRWKIDGSNPHWPASDFHPDHKQYPESGGCLGSKLDACRPMEKGETYNFIFNEEGSWGMHDHLFHGHTMVVNVTKEEENPVVSYVMSLLPKKINPGDCRKYVGGSPEQEKCFTMEILAETPGYKADSAKIAKLIREKCNGQNACYAPLFVPLTLEKGYEYAFDVTFELRKIDRVIGDSCHSVAHQIGWASYRADPKNWKATLRKMDNRCSWGALHGMVEEHIARTKQRLDKSFVKTLCDGDVPCNHGVGHLVLVQAEGDLHKALDVCAVLKIYDERHHCMSGVFMERMTWQNTVDREFDPVGRRQQYWIGRIGEFEKLCESFSGQPQNACWTEIARPAIDNYDADPKKVFDLCLKASSEEASNYCRRRAALDLVPRYHYKLQEIKYICEMAPSYDRNFKRDCYLHIAFLSVTNLPPNQKSKIVEYCSSVPTVYKSGCFDILNGTSLFLSIKNMSPDPMK